MADVRILMKKGGRDVKLLINGQELRGCRRVSFDLEAGDLPVVEIEILSTSFELVGDDVKLLAAAGAEFILKPDERRELLDAQRSRTHFAEVAVQEFGRGKLDHLLPGGASASARALSAKYAALPDDVRLDILESLHIITSAEAERCRGDVSELYGVFDVAAFQLASDAGVLDIFRHAIESATRNVESDALRDDAFGVVSAATGAGDIALQPTERRLDGTEPAR
jgi:hypothetical protein